LLPNIEGVKNVIFNSYTMGVDVTSLFQVENTFEVADDMSRTVRSYVLSFGVVYPNAPKGILFPGGPGVPNTLSPTRYGNVAPRAAGSWAPKARAGMLAHVLGAPGATLVKAGYRMYYGVFEGLPAGIMSGNPPHELTDTSVAPTLFGESCADGGSLKTAASSLLVHSKARIFPHRSALEVESMRCRLPRAVVL
jgi:hypothetical protein